MPDQEAIGKPPSELGRREIVAGLALAGVAAVPLVGGSAVELIGVVLQPVIHRRRDEWLEQLGSAVDELRANAVDIRTLGDNDLLITVILNATAAAMRTHEEEKLRALRNAVVNSALALGPDEHTHMMFVRFVEEFTALHLQLLAYLRDPAGWYADHDLPAQRSSAAHDPSILRPHSQSSTAGPTSTSSYSPSLTPGVSARQACSVGWCRRRDNGTRPRRLLATPSSTSSLGLRPRSRLKKLSRLE